LDEIPFPLQPDPNVFIMAIEIKKTIYHQSGAVYGLGFIGAAIYFIMNASGFWMGVVGILKAIVWPAIVVFKMLEVLNM
jgi:hypothetical protein